MSLLIKGMDMPKNGRVTIDLASEETGTNILARITDDKTGKLIGHEGVVVISSPHGDLIDRDKLIQFFLPIMEFPEDERIMYVDSFIRALKSAPTIIEAEE